MMSFDLANTDYSNKNFTNINLSSKFNYSHLQLWTYVEIYNFKPQSDLQDKCESKFVKSSAQFCIAKNPV